MRLFVLAAHGNMLMTDEVPECARTSHADRSGVSILTGGYRELEARHETSRDRTRQKRRWQNLETIRTRRVER